MLLTTLKRYPDHKKDNLQAWDSADELLLKYLESCALADKRVLIINDAFGALACSLSIPGGELTSYTDSFVSQKAILRNSSGARQTLSDLEALSGVYDFVLIKLPKNLSFLEDILCRITLHDHGKWHGHPARG